MYDSIHCRLISLKHLRHFRYIIRDPQIKEALGHDEDRGQQHAESVFFVNIFQNGLHVFK